MEDAAVIAVIVIFAAVAWAALMLLTRLAPSNYVGTPRSKTAIMTVKFTVDARNFMVALKRVEDATLEAEARMRAWGERFAEALKQAKDGAP